MDYVIRNVRIVDGSGDPSFVGDLGVEGERFAFVGPHCPAKGKREIDGTGLAAAPGFVDIHSHSDYYLLIGPRAEGKVLQGVTTEIGGNCGYSAAPIFGRIREERIKTYRDLFGLSLPWEGVGDYYRHLSETGMSVNFGLLAGHNTIRSSAMYGSNRAPSPEERKTMISTLCRAVEEGALGLSTGLIYPPACFADADELVTLCKAVAEKGGIFAVHMRSEGNRLLEAIDEVIAVAGRSGVPLQISHLKTSGRKNWGKLEEVFDRIESARRRGIDVACDRYPYTASNTGLSAVLPDWTFEGGVERLLARLAERTERSRMAEEILREHPEPDYFANIMICAVTRPEHEHFVARRVLECAETEGKAPIDFVADLLIAERNMVDAIYFTMSPDNLRRILKKPYVMIGSDSGAKAFDGPLGEGNPHPRAYGTCPRVLQQFVREEGLLTLEEAVRKMTSQPLERVGVRGRGRIRERLAADLVLFDPDRIEDPATYEDPKQPPRGIERVWVNGTVVVEEGRHTGARPGRILRKERRAP
ncbi:MAG: D-aminoacylase [Deltaproteobacteria bacterium]|nr:D-aminoacylase [Deltaproteobacteria bacterium]